MTTQEIIEKHYHNRLKKPTSVDAIPRGVYMVYVLVCDGKPIAVGHGKHNRARVIFDDRDHITPSHIKAFFVRAYQLFGGQSFERYLIECNSKSEAGKIENDLHDKIGGNSRSLPEKIEKRIFARVAKRSVTEMVLRIALNSSFDGLADLKLWRKKDILDDQVWEEIAAILNLKDPKQNAKSAPGA